MNHAAPHNTQVMKTNKQFVFTIVGVIVHDTGSTRPFLASQLLMTVVLCMPPQKTLAGHRNWKAFGYFSYFTKTSLRFRQAKHTLILHNCLILGTWTVVSWLAFSLTCAVPSLRTMWCRHTESPGHDWQTKMDASERWLHAWLPSFQVNLCLI